MRILTDENGWIKDFNISLHNTPQQKMFKRQVVRSIIRWRMTVKASHTETLAIQLVIVVIVVLQSKCPLGTYYCMNFISFLSHPFSHLNTRGIISNTHNSESSVSQDS